MQMQDEETATGLGRGKQNGWSRREVLVRGGLAAAGAAVATPALAACGSNKSKKLTVWWNAGFYPEEDKAVKAIANDWAKQSGHELDLQFYSTDDIPTKEQSAVTSGELPDVIEAENGNTATYAYQGHLIDVSDVVHSTPLTEGSLKSVHLFNSKAGKAGYYAVPVSQFTVSMFYWKDMIAKAGMGQPPGDWNGYWKFFEDAQTAYQKKTGKQVSALGWPMSTSAGDTHYDTQTALMAFDAMVLDANGNLAVDDPKVKAGMIKALAWLSGLYRDGFVPKDAVNWKDDDNNTAFANKSIIATPNGSLSIPGAVKGKNDKVWKEIVTTQFPSKPSGEPMPSSATVHNAVIFEKSPNQDAAKDFLKFFIKPENTIKWLKAGQARWFPVQQSLLKDDYFAASDDPNVKVVAEQLSGTTVPAWVNQSVAYSNAELRGMWGNALGQIVLQKKSPSDAADYAIAQLKEAFNNFPAK